jgi:two-component system, LytTR family, sensor kinase
MPQSSAPDQPPPVPRVFGNLHGFWVLQTFGWSMYFLVHLLVLANEGTWDARTLYGYVTATVGGFSITLLMRLIYRQRARSGPSLGWMVFLLLGSFAGANLIMVVADLPKLLFWRVDEVFPPLKMVSYLQRLYWWMLYCTAWSVLYFGYKFWQAWKVREQRTVQAIAAAEAAQIQMLRYRLNPAFLFQALSAVRDVIGRDGRQARVAVTELSEYLRYSLASREQAEVPLCDEIRAVRRFLAVRETTVGARLQAAFDVDPCAETFPVPPFTILPLVERAALDGADRADAPAIRVAVRLRSSLLRIELGSPGLLQGFRSDTSVLPPNLQAVRRRLEDKYASKCCFEVSQADGRIVSAVIEIPRD